MEENTQDHISMLVDDRTQAFRIKQWEQAWQQYRQNETTRSGLLSLYFAFVGIVVAAGLNLAKGTKFDAPLLLAGIAVVDLLLLLATLFALSIVVKLGAVNWHYDKKITDLTDQLTQGFAPTDRQRALSFSPHKSMNGIVNPKVLKNGQALRIQVIAERVLALLLGVFATLEVLFLLLAAFGWWPIPIEYRSNVEGWLVGLVFLVAICAVCWWLIRVACPAWPSYQEIRGRDNPDT